MIGVLAFAGTGLGLGDRWAVPTLRLGVVVGFYCFGVVVGCAG